MAWQHRLRNLFRRDRVDSDIEREISFHIAERTDELIASGMSEEDARLTARRQFGNRSVQKERTREMDIIGWIESIEQDVRFASRTLRRSPMFSIVVVLSLAIGIGANTAAFSLADGMLIRKLPVAEPDRLVVFEWISGKNRTARTLSGDSYTDPVTREESSSSFSYLTFQRFREQSRTLSDVFSFAPLNSMNISVDGQPGRVDAQIVSGNYFTALGIPAVIGRTLTDDDVRESNPVAVISYSYWQRRFDLDPAALGKVMLLNGVPLTIVGVGPERFSGALGFRYPMDISIPIALQSQFPLGPDRRQAYNWWLCIMGRMKPETTDQQVRAELENVLQATAMDGWNAAPNTADLPPRDLPRLRVLPGQRGLGNGATVPMLLVPLAIISVIVLLIVCVNVANLLLARMEGRGRELGVRLALGGGRFRVVRQLVTETALLSLLGAAFGLILAYLAKDLLLITLTQNSGETALDLRLDTRVLLFAAALSILIGVSLGLAPALRATRRRASATINEYSRTLSTPRTRVRKALIVIQVALSLVMLVGAGLFIRTVGNLRNIDHGFDANNLLLFKLNPKSLKYDDGRTATIYRQALESISGLPGVVGVTFSNVPLVNSGGSGSQIYLEGREVNPGDFRFVRELLIGNDFFKTMRAPIVAGRDFNDNDNATGPRVALINETLAHRLYKNTNPVGARFSFRESGRLIYYEIVGIVRDVRIQRVRQEIPPTMYLSAWQTLPGTATFAVRTAAEPLSLAGPIRESLRGIDSNVPMFDVTTQIRHIETGFTIERIFAVTAGFFGVMALVLASIGLFGLMSYNVERRRSEIGIRMALGARRSDVIRLVMRQTVVLLGIGVSIGLAGSYLLTRALARMPLLYRVSPTDPLTIGLAMSTMIAIACLAAFLPARRASRVDPTIALRCD